MANGVTVAVVGATGAAGQTTLKILEERKFPVRELRAFASERSVGKTVMFAGDAVRVQKVEAPAFKGVDIAICSAGSAQAREYAPMIAKAGAIVVDKSNGWRMDPQVPLVVPEVNPHAVRAHHGIIASPNCTTIVAIMPLKPLHDAGRLRRVVATSYQSVSGAGVQGIAALREETLAWARGEAVTPKHFAHQIAFNLIPAIDTFTPDGYSGEERKLINETHKILGDDSIRVSPTCARVPVPVGHSQSINLRTRDDLSPERCREILAAAPSVTVVDDPADGVYPLAADAAGRDDVLVGRIRRDPTEERTLNLWVVSDNLRKGAALNAVQLAELLAQRSLVGTTARA